MLLNKIHLDALYSKAEAAFRKCAELNDTELSGELGAPLDSIRTLNDWISVKYSGVDDSTYEIETRLLLFLTGDKPIGWYCCHENENGEHLDDFLVLE